MRLDTTASTTESGYRWYILALGVATHVFVAALPLACIPVLLPEMAADLDLNLVQVGMVWGIISLPGMFIAIFGGMLVDKYGTAKVLALTCLFTSLTCALRGTAGGYNSLLAYSILFGAAQVPLAMTVHKSAAEWFSGKQLGLANGILAMGMGAGGILASMISATWVSPMVGGWRNVMFVYAAFAFVFTFLWLQTKGRSAPQNNPRSSGDTIDFKKSILHVLKLKPIWIIAITQIFVAILRNGVVGYLPTYLEGIGWSTVEASGALSVLSATSVIGVIPLSLFSDRIGLRKSVLIPSYLITCLCVGLLAANNSAVIWPMVVLIGFFQEGIAAIVITTTMETEGVGATYAGTALGINTTASKLGAVIGPPLGNKMSAIQPTYGFIFWAVMGGVATTLFFFIKETGWRKKRYTV